MQAVANAIQGSNSTAPPSPAAPVTIQAASFLAGDTFGAQNDGPEVCGSFGVCNFGQGISFVESGDWVRYRGVDFGASGTLGLFEANVATPNSGADITVFVDGIPSQEAIARQVASDGSSVPPATGSLIANLSSAATTTVLTDFNTYSNEWAPLTQPIGGVHDVYILFLKQNPPGTSGPGLGIGNFSTFTFLPRAGEAAVAAGINQVGQTLTAQNANATALAGQLDQAVAQLHTSAFVPLLGFETPIMSAIQNADSTFFSRFATNVTSGQPALVQAALLEGDAKLIDLLRTSPQPGVLPGLGPVIAGFAPPDDLGGGGEGEGEGEAEDFGTIDGQVLDSGQEQDIALASVESASLASMADSLGLMLQDTELGADTLTQTNDFIQFDNVLQFGNFIEFGTVLLVAAYVAAWIAWPAIQPVQAAFQTGADPLQQDILVGTITQRLAGQQLTISLN